MDSTRVPGTCILRKLSYLHQSIIALFTGIIPLLHSTGELININFTGQPFSRPTPVKRLNLFHREFIIIPVTGEPSNTNFTDQSYSLHLPVNRLIFLHRYIIIIPSTVEHKKSKFTGRGNALCPTGELSILYIHLNPYLIVIQRSLIIT